MRRQLQRRLLGKRPLELNLQLILKEALDGHGIVFE